MKTVSVIAHLLAVVLLLVTAPASVVEAAGGGNSGTGILCEHFEFADAGDRCEEFADEGQEGLEGVIVNIVNILLFVAGALSVVVLIVAGFMYTASGGEPEKTKKAKNAALYAVVGLVVAFLAWAAVDFVIGQIESA